MGWGYQLRHHLVDANNMLHLHFPWVSPWHRKERRRRKEGKKKERNKNGRKEGRKVEGEKTNNLLLGVNLSQVYYSNTKQKNSNNGI